ncbi:MAG: Ig-like domain-containing protein [Vicinamibacterales bacterium]
MSTVAAPWAARDIGSPTLPGSSSFDQSSGTFTIDAAGTDIWGAADQFHFVYQTLTGDGTVVARVNSVSYAQAWSKAGVMIRSSLSPDAAHGYALVSAGKGTAFQRRTTTGAASTTTPGPAGTPPSWVRITRKSSTITAAVSADGGTWTTIGSDTIALGSTAYVGLAVTSHDPTRATTAALSNVAVASSSTLPAPQKDADIGNPAVAGSASYSQGVYTVAGAGGDIWGTADQFHYVYQPISGDVDLSVRVSSIGNADRWTKAGLMIRENLTAGSAHAFVGVSSQRGYFFQRRPLANDVTVGTDGGLGTAPGWVRIKRSGALITTYRSADGTNWTVIGSDSFSMSAAVYVGLAVTSHNPAQSVSATFDTLKIVQSQPPSNQPPAVTLTSPASGTSYTAPATANLAATASDTDGTVARVDFYNGSTLLGSDATAPYALSWTNIAAGSYSVTAIAYDDAGASTTSAAATITVNAANGAPAATLTAPANGASFTSPASVSLTANATDSDGTIARVDFYNGSALLGSDTTAPYAFTWANVAAGTYAVRAVAIDNTGASTSSATATITVTAANTPPTVSLTSPANGASYAAPATIALNATAADSNGTVARVEFYAGSTLLNSDSAAPYSFTWSNVLAGTYAVRAIAYDNAGATTSSATATVTVAAAQPPPTAVVFTASTDHATVTSYLLEIFSNGADPNTAVPVASSDLGKPAPAANGDITVNRATLFSGLAPGTYVLTVSSIAPGGRSRSTLITFTR